MTGERRRRSDSMHQTHSLKNHGHRIVHFLGSLALDIVVVSIANGLQPMQQTASAM